MSSSSGTKFSVYVAGIPTKTTRHEIETYFCQFGKIDDVQTFNNCQQAGRESKDANQGRNKGYCVLLTSCRQTYNTILDFQKHTIFGRSILCAKYQEGSKLMRLNRLNNQRRVIIRNVPAEFKQDELQVYFDTIIGKVDILYEFKEDGSLHQNFIQDMEKSPPNSSSTKSYSVMFSEKSDAQTLIGQGKVQGPRNCLLLVDRYKPQSKRRNDSDQIEMQSKVDYTTSKDRSCFTTAIRNSIRSDLPYWSGYEQESIRPNSKLYFTVRNKESVKLTYPLKIRLLHNEVNLRFNFEKRVEPSNSMNATI